MLSKNNFRFLQSFSSCTMMKLVRDWRRIRSKKTKKFSQTIAEKVSAPEQHIHQTIIVKNQSEKIQPYKEQNIANNRLQDNKVISWSIGG